MNDLTGAIAATAVVDAQASRAQVLEPVGPAVGGGEPDWFRAAVESFRAQVADPLYPCHFGRLSLRDRDITVLAVESHHDVAELAAELRSFCESIRFTPERKRVFAAFLRSESPARACPHLEHEAYGRRFWQILADLRAADVRAWPADVPADPDHPQWEFSFHNTPMFVFAAPPTHVERPSRRLCDHLVVMFQPRNVFAGIEGGTVAGEAARRAVRRKLEHWDDAPVHPSMGNYGDPSNLEWRQYYIPDGQHDMWGRCPLAADDRPRHRFSRRHLQAVAETEPTVNHIH